MRLTKRMVMKHYSFLFLFAFMLLCFVSCSDDKESKGLSTIDAEIWEPFISAYTSGIVSREATIRIRFTTDVVSEEAVGRPVDNSLLKFEPAIKGTALFSDRRTLEFKPDNRLKDGASFTGLLAMKKIMSVPAKCNVFKFAFMALKQSVDLKIIGLVSVDQSSARYMELHGVIVTADVENGDAVERLIIVNQGSRKLKVRWIHDANGLQHSFSADSVERFTDTSKVNVQWSGTLINADESGTLSVSVPPIEEFIVLGTSVIDGTNPYISIIFSDPLLKDQNLNGLVSIDKESSISYSIEKNILKLFPENSATENFTITVYPGIKSISGKQLKRAEVLPVEVETVKPQVRFTGEGNIVPASIDQPIPFEAINVKSVDVRAFRIYDNNISQFLQVNDLSGYNEIRRVGRTVWSKTIELDPAGSSRNRWIRGGFDLSTLLTKEPNAIYRIELRINKNGSYYECEGDSVSVSDAKIEKVAELNEDDEDESSYWDFYNDYGGDFDWDEYYNNRENPCHAAYYRRYNSDNKAGRRNFFFSNIGLIAKQGSDDTLCIIASNLVTAQPISGADITVQNYQNQPIGKGSTGSDGIVRIKVKGKPFLAVASYDGQRGYLKVNPGSELSVSTFDVSGTAIKKGLKGFIYGERGVWRPGDSIYLTFVLEDKAKTLPADHPVTFELFNPKGQIVQTITRSQSLNRFYNFATATANDALTGEYTAKVRIGGTVFEQILKIENVVPNRLKVRLNFDSDTLEGCSAVNALLTAQWLHGATAGGFKFDIAAVMQPLTASFLRYAEYTFSDPTKNFTAEMNDITSGNLDNNGKTSLSLDLKCPTEIPGMIKAVLRTRVFENSGAFSIDRSPIVISPYSRYIGILPPKGDKARGMLLTDTLHSVRVVALNRHGQQVQAKRVQMKLVKIGWRWWWEKGNESLADYISSSEKKIVMCDTITLESGSAIWKFRVAYPEWGRYLLLASDLDEGHSAGKTVYIDWPSWAGRSQSNVPGGASLLSFSCDKEEYVTNEKAYITVPSNVNGQILVSIETGSRVLKQFWVKGSAKETVISLPITSEMAPTSYASLTYIQPHGQTANDLPIRMYGIIPIKVKDPATIIEPVVNAPSVLRPEQKALIKVAEKSGRDMTYTLALVDEGLLDLTRFQTPAPWSYFYQREALGVKTWDLYDFVCGAFGAKISRLFSVGGDDGAVNPAAKRGNRFPPMVRFAGPFYLKRGTTDLREVSIPQYVGSVRLMVVAGQDGAYGQYEQSIPVRKPLMVLGALPRVLGPMETVKLPISVFALEKHIKNVTLQVDIKGNGVILGKKSEQLSFKETGDEFSLFELRTGETAGWIQINITAKCGTEIAKQTMNVEVRTPVRTVYTVTDTLLRGKSVWTRTVKLPGIAGTNAAKIEISKIPPLNLDKRLNYLIKYPYGCVEQTTSSVFPQLYLGKLMDLSADRKSEIQRNVQAGIGRLRSFQNSKGGFTYWPGQWEADSWATNYVGHFLLEAKAVGYSIPNGMLESWIRYQKRNAGTFYGTLSSDLLIQAYRLYVLALARNPEFAAMNRMKEMAGLTAAAKWRLAAAYQLTGQKEIADELINGIPNTVKDAKAYDATYGSLERDEAMILETLTLLKREKQAIQVAKLISGYLCNDRYMSTQTTAYTLLAMAKYFGTNNAGGEINAVLKVSGAKDVVLKSRNAIIQKDLPLSKNAVNVQMSLSNNIDDAAWIRVVGSGLPVMGTENAASEGVNMSVKYMYKNGDVADIASIEQGTDIVAEITVSSEPGRGISKNMALSCIFPSGWEIRNSRMEGTAEKESPFTYRDIKDDRVITFFDLPANEPRIYRFQLNASYLGKYYMPPVTVEAMYDATMFSRIPGKWVNVIYAGK
ncbi:MAG: hypothetical protein JNL74_01455 [Fibrobacteres bacterium]|nr:hypothetical protein [Fibrobacterota bacterium]